MKNKTKLNRSEIIKEMSQRKHITKNRYLISLILQTRYYCFNIRQFNKGGIVYVKAIENEEVKREQKLKQLTTLLIDKETNEFLRVNLKDFLEVEFYPLVFNYPDINEIKKYFKRIRYYGNTPEDFKEFEIKTLQSLKEQNRPDLSDFYEVAE
ncbi:MAG: hypothetical protein VZR09_11060 [Candidatus Gastranaerophilaceae bacterium]|nr:hypothetical protein [Candidatus Gastranaerophilaceae bacterium]